MTRRRPIHPSIGTWSVAGLALGFLLGLAGRLMDLSMMVTFSGMVAPLGTLWMRALQMTVVPLVVAQLLAALVLPQGAKPFGRLGGRAVALFLGFSLAGGLLAAGLSRAALGFFPAPPDLLASIPAQSLPELPPTAGEESMPEGVEWLVGLIPRNPLEAAVNGDLLQVLVFTVLVGLAASRLPDAQRDPLSRVFRSLADAMMILVGWILWGTPVGVFSIMLSLTLGAGWGAIGLVVLFFFLICGVMVLVTLGLYPVSAVWGRVSLVTFAKGVFPSQVVAATTQSSLASLPALIEGGRKELGLPPESTGFVLPLWVATFRVNQTVSPMVKLLFLTHFFQVPLGLGNFWAFLLGSLLLGLTSAGLPRGGGGMFNRLPLYLAVGIPLEGYLLLEAVKHSPIYDGCATVLNVTGDMAAATILAGSGRVGSGAEAG